MSFPYKHICVIGTSASGKTTFARILAEKIGAIHIELDEHFHEPNWKPASNEVFIARVMEKMQSERWIVDGNYGNRAKQFDEADLIIWLDFPLPILLSRVLSRTFRRIISKQELWNGNRESLRMTFSRESIVWWVLSTYSHRRVEFSRLLESNKYPNARWIRFKHPKQARQFLNGI